MRTERQQMRVVENDVYVIIQIKETKNTLHPADKRIAIEYEAALGKLPFREWLLQLRDGRAQAKITMPIA